MIADLLRDKYGYDGIVCTDWGVTRDSAGVDRFGASQWGVEGLTEAERYYKALLAGVDQFGGNNDPNPVIEAYEMGVQEHGEEFMRARFEASAFRLLRNMFRTGLFDNPYVAVEDTVSAVGNPEYMAAGYEAQVKSLVLVKNQSGVLPLKRGTTVYIPQRCFPESRSFFGRVNPARYEEGVNLDIAGKFFNTANDPGGADAAIVVIHSPESGLGYERSDAEAGGNGYLPMSLQYGRYTASLARTKSIAGGGPLDAFTNRSYRGKSVTAFNVTDLQAVLDVRKKMQGKPVIVVLKMSNPAVVSEFEPSADAILVSFGVQDQAVLEVLSGSAEPSGLLPLQMPADMNTVEEQAEDTPHDMRSHIDAVGNAYNFGFGLNWTGVIRDDRTRTYVKQGGSAAATD